jgi:O-antigen/teichoic acid export membrane protein
LSNKSEKVIVVTLAQVVSLLVSFLMSPYLSRSLSKEEYAAYNLTLVIITLVGLLFSMGIPNAVYKVLAQKSVSDKPLHATLQFSIIASGILATVGLFVASFIVPYFFSPTHIGTYLKFCCVNLCITFLHNYFVSTLIFNSKVKSAALISLLLSITNVAVIFAAFYFYHNVLLALLLSLVAVPFLFLIISFTVAKPYISKTTFFSKPAFKEIAATAVPLYATSLLGSSYVYVSSFFTSLALGEVAYANYRNGAIEIPFISTVAFSISAVLLPDIARYFQQEKLHEAFELKKKVINQSIRLLYPVIIYFIIFHKEFIITYFSDKYAASAIVFAIYSCTCFIRINDYQDVLVSSGNSRYILKANVQYFAINLLLVTVLGYLFGITGVAAAASISVFILAYTLLKKSAFVFKKQIADFFEVKPALEIIILSSVFLLGIKILFTQGLKINNIMLLILAAGLYFPFIYFYIYKKDYLLPSVVNSVKQKLGLFKLLQKKSK